jgi:hypothetical protein
MNELKENRYGFGHKENLLYFDPIERLYSAGELGSFWGWMYNGGGNNAESLCTGQIAGRNVAAAKPVGKPG